MNTACKRLSTTECILQALPRKGGSTMGKKLEVVLEWLERVATIVSIVVPATRKVVALLEPNKAE